MIRTVITCDVCKEVIPKNTLFFQIARRTGNDIKVMCHVCGGCTYRIAERKVKNNDTL